MPDVFCATDVVSARTHSSHATSQSGSWLYDSGEKEPARRSRLLCLTGLLRRRDGGDGLQAEGNDLGTDHLARNDQFDATVLLAACGGIV
jgi:hypothetical protein